MKNLDFSLLKFWYWNLHILPFTRAHYMSLGWHLYWCNFKTEKILGTLNPLKWGKIANLGYLVFFQFWSYINIIVTLKSENESLWMVKYVSFNTKTLRVKNSSFSFLPYFPLVLYSVKIGVLSIFSFLQLHQNNLHPKVTYGQLKNGRGCQF